MNTSDKDRVAAKYLARVIAEYVNVLTSIKNNSIINYANDLQQLY